MPVSDFQEDDEFNQLLIDNVSYPSAGKEKMNIVVPQRCDDASLVGTAFEFLLQYELLRHHIETKPIIGLYVSQLMLGQERPQALQKLIYNNRGEGNQKELKFIRYVRPSALGAARASHLDNQEIKTKIHDFYNYAERKLEEYDSALFGANIIEYIPDYVFVIAIKLAKLEAFYRSGVLAEDFDDISENDLSDLMDLISQLDKNKLDATNYCLCSPYFAHKGKHVTGFDMDLVLDNMLVDVKTTKNPNLNKKQINQLVIYYLLSRLFGIEAYPLKRRIDKVAVYFARYDYLQVMGVRDLLTMQNETMLKKWIKARIASAG